MNQEPKPITTLKPADYNPRTITKHNKGALNASINDFGDLSSIVNNVTTGNLVGGHQRIAVLLADPHSQIEYTEKFEQPDELGTVARGYVVVPGTAIKLPYREVAWDREKEMQANVVANYAQGEFVKPMLAAVTAELHKISMAAAEKTGQRQEEIKDLLKSLEKPKEPEQQPPKEIFSLPGETYRLGHATITAGEYELEFVDRVRQDYAESQSQADEWLTYCGPIGIVPVAPPTPPAPAAQVVQIQTVPGAQPDETITPTV